MIVDITGRRYGRLTVLGRSGAKEKNSTWRCRCECGNECVVQYGNLKSGHTKSCGCLSREKSAGRLLTHGMKQSQLYKAWAGMKNRCNNQRSKDWPDYGGRGIEVCPEWRDSFEAFRDWALANGYQDDLTIERKDVNGNYCPENCKWATAEEQANNKRSNRMATYNGKTQTMAMWSREVGIPADTLIARLNRGWTVEKALEEPVRKQYRHKGGKHGDANC